MNRNSTPYSQLKVFYHQDVLQHLLRGERCNPVYIRIKPTNKCNHNCSYCHYKNAYLDLNDDYNLSDEIPRDKMLEIVSDISDMGVKAVTFSGGGEPLLYPHFEETMERVLEAGIDLSIITNGSLLSGRRAELLAKAKWVRISIESVDDEEYCSIRGIKEGAFRKLCENISDFAEIKEDTCELGINVVVNNKNCHEVMGMARLMKELGVNHVKFAPMITNDTKGYHKDFKDEVTEQLIRAQDEYGSDTFRIIDLYTGDFADSVIFERQYSRCPIKEFICVIAANSKVYYCHDKAYLKDGLVGSIKEQSFKELWLSDETTELFRNFDAKKSCRQHCVYDSRNELINSFLDMDRNHINFI
ncbi:MAG: radical SAM protein [Lachnospiraceae bacterium]|nr:radical SAM protein [Lachnospiraceae bacterium]